MERLSLKQTQNKRLLVTGGNGFVAGSVIRQAGPEWELHALSRQAALLDSPGLCWHRFEPFGQSRLDQVFQLVRPVAVIHTAALADIDFCQTHQREAQAVNVGLTGWLTELCDLHRAKLVFCSTDSIFDGEHAPYREDDTPGPVNFYAETKIAAERLVAALGAQAVIARLALVVGLPVLGAGNSFLAKMLATLRAGRPVPAFVNEVRTPIDVVTLGRALLELAGSNHSGVFHLSGNDSVSRFELARRIASRFGFTPDLVVGTDSSTISGRAPRARDVSLDNRKARTTLSVPMLGLNEALDLIIETASAAASCSAP